MYMGTSTSADQFGLSVVLTWIASTVLKVKATVLPANSDSDVILCLQFLKGTATLMITRFYMKDLNKP